MQTRMDPTLSLAVSVHGNPGVYALLLGSGISRAAGVPTGWDIILDLIQRVARLHEEDAPRERAESWYRERFNREPEYGQLLSDLALAPSERQQLLRPFFEPTPEEREEGRKLPTEAHRAIAELVEKGYIRVIVTTNFDRLMERALEDRGITPTIIASVDAVRGARPLAHSRCTIIKIHGDYLDARIRNTPRELEKYPGPLNRLLDQVFDEYGLLVCGWSATWDPALRSALERARSHRFTTYWTEMGEPGEAAKSLIQLRGAHLIRIDGADSLFRDLAERVTSLEEMARPHPLSAAIAVQTLKRYLPNPLHRIRLFDLVMDETRRLLEALPLDDFARAAWSPAEFNRQVRYHEEVTGTLIDLYVAGCFHGGGEHDALWAESLARIARATGGLRDGQDLYIRALSYPALLLMYAGGIAAVASENFTTLRALTVDVRRPDDNGREHPLVVTLHPHSVMERDVPRLLPDMERHHTPFSDHIQRILLPHLVPYLGDAQRFERVFDRVEYLLFLIHGDLNRVADRITWAPVGSFAWRGRRSVPKDPPALVAAELDAQKDAWPPLKAGLFGGDIKRLRESKAELDEHLGRVRRQMH